MKSGIPFDNAIADKFTQNKKLQKNKLKEFNHLELFFKNIDKLSVKKMSTEYPDAHGFFRK